MWLRFEFDTVFTCQRFKFDKVFTCQRFKFDRVFTCQRFYFDMSEAWIWQSNLQVRGLTEYLHMPQIWVTQYLPVSGQCRPREGLQMGGKNFTALYTFCWLSYCFIHFFADRFTALYTFCWLFYCFIHFFAECLTALYTFCWPFYCFIRIFLTVLLLYTRFADCLQPKMEWNEEICS